MLSIWFWLGNYLVNNLVSNLGSKLGNTLKCNSDNTYISQNNANFSYPWNRGRETVKCSKTERAQTALWNPSEIHEQNLRLYVVADVGMCRQHRPHTNTATFSQRTWKNIKKKTCDNWYATLPVGEPTSDKCILDSLSKHKNRDLTTYPLPSSQT